MPWNRAAIHWEFARRSAFCRWPVHGNVLEAFRAGRLEVGEHTLFEPNVWLTLPDAARVRIGSGTFLNMNVMVAAQHLVVGGELENATHGRASGSLRRSVPRRAAPRAYRRRSARVGVKRE